MAQTDLRLWLLSSIWGAGLGFFYFGGLWWTLRSLPGKPHPRARLILSFAVRLLFTLFGFWVVIQKDVVAFFLTIAGFFLARFYLTRKLKAVGGSRRDADQP